MGVFHRGGFACLSDNFGNWKDLYSDIFTFLNMIQIFVEFILIMNIRKWHPPFSSLVSCFGTVHGGSATAYALRFL